VHYESWLLGHTKIESTVRYLGIEVDDALAIAEQVDVWNARAEQACSARAPTTVSCQQPTFELNEDARRGTLSLLAQLRCFLQGVLQGR
jgi:hypothetical protein